MDYIDYLPEVYRETAEYQALGQGVDPLVGALREKVWEIPESYFPLTATEELVRWEQLLGLSGSGGVEERRFAVQSRLAGIRPYTIEQLCRQLRAAMGDRFTAEVWPENFLLRVSVSPGAEPLLSAMVRELRRMIPANMELETAVGQADSTTLYAGVLLAVSERVKV